MTNRIRNYGEADETYLEGLTADDDDHWRWDNVVEAKRLVAEADVKTLVKARKLNNDKARFLQWAHPQSSA